MILGKEFRQEFDVLFMYLAMFWMVCNIPTTFWWFDIAGGTGKLRLRWLINTLAPSAMFLSGWWGGRQRLSKPYLVLTLGSVLIITQILILTLVGLED